jgi:hypothetical protein
MEEECCGDGRFMTDACDILCLLLGWYCFCFFRYGFGDGFCIGAGFDTVSTAGPIVPMADDEFSAGFVIICFKFAFIIFTVEAHDLGLLDVVVVFIQLKE